MKRTRACMRIYGEYKHWFVFFLFFLAKELVFLLRRFLVMTVLPRRFACNLFLLDEFILVARILILLTKIAFYSILVIRITFLERITFEKGKLMWTLSAFNFAVWGHLEVHSQIRVKICRHLSTQKRVRSNSLGTRTVVSTVPGRLFTVSLFFRGILETGTLRWNCRHLGL